MAAPPPMFGRDASGCNQRGMTMVELLVAMVIGLGVILAVTSLLITGENHKRATTSTNDAEQTGTYAFNALDRVVRGAGSGFAESVYDGDRGVLGCRLNVTSILPRTGAFLPPFAAFLGGAPGNLRVAPVLIGANQSADGVSDVLAVMGGSGAAGGVSRQITGNAGVNTPVLDNVVGLFTSDLMLVSQSGTPDCLLEEVSSITSPNLTLGSKYSTAGTTTTLATLLSSNSSYLTPLGNAAVNNLQFMLFGVDANHTLFSYDLLQNQTVQQSPSIADAAQPIADGVYQFHAIYGINTKTTNDGTQTNWAGPTDANYTINAVMGSQNTMLSIVSVRIGLVVRGEYYDKNMVQNVVTPVSPLTFTLFQGLKNAAGGTLQQIVTLNTANGDRQYRYRVFEFTVPLRNMILLASGP